MNIKKIQSIKIQWSVFYFFFLSSGYEDFFFELCVRSHANYSQKCTTVECISLSISVAAFAYHRVNCHIGHVCVCVRVPCAVCVHTDFKNSEIWVETVRCEANSVKKTQSVTRVANRTERRAQKRKEKKKTNRRAQALDSRNSHRLTQYAIYDFM